MSSPAQVYRIDPTTKVSRTAIQIREQPFVVSIHGLSPIIFGGKFAVIVAGKPPRPKLVTIRINPFTQGSRPKLA
jgi:hypothetical protein